MPSSPDVVPERAVSSSRDELGSAVVFSDLDGTLLDAENYRHDAALPALEMLRARGIGLVLCSSKTRLELEVHRRRLNSRDPFIYENGGGIGVPKGPFPFAGEGDASGDCVVIPLGTAYDRLRGALVALRDELGVRVTGFGDLSASGVAALTGLPLGEADLARRREFDEPFVFDDQYDPRATEFLRAIEDRGLHWTRGRFFHILGENDKGRATRLVTEMFRRARPDLTTIGIGDSLNDLPMLESVDIPVLVQRADGSYVDGVRSPRLVRADGVGPVGWNRAVLGLFGR